MDVSTVKYSTSNFSFFAKFSIITKPKLFDFPTLRTAVDARSDTATFILWSKLTLGIECPTVSTEPSAEEIISRKMSQSKNIFSTSGQCGNKMLNIRYFYLSQELVPNFSLH